MQRPEISLIVPTRNNALGMKSFLESVRQTAANPDSIEVVMVVDEDDDASQRIEFSGLRLIKVVVPAGLTMGALNMAGYEASSGTYLMLNNDDVIVKTLRWDEKVRESFAAFPDGIVLVHTNDTIFEDKLCTFPFLTRAYCELAKGICPTDYARYRIDDHIYNVFNCLGLIGHKRIVYRPDIVFEHHNHTLNEAGQIVYVPNPSIHAQDTKAFDAMFEGRKSFAVRLAEHIDDFRRSEVSRTRSHVLALFEDSVSMRLPELVRVMPGGKPERPRVAIGVVSANMDNDHAQICLSLLKKHTRSFDLILLDNNRGPGFNHAREMNRIIDACRADYLVLMDDDVWVTPGWLDSLLACLSPDVGVVTPMHRGPDGRITYCGVVMRPDLSGHHSHDYKVPATPQPIQTLCSAIMLLDMTKVGHIRVDESFSKYFLDIDYGLRVWEEGFGVVIDSNCACTHLAGATLTQGGQTSNHLFETQRRTWLRKWAATGRMADLQKSRWEKVASLRKYEEFPATLDALIRPASRRSVDEFLADAIPKLAASDSVPALMQFIQDKVVEACDGQFVSVHDPDLGHLMLLYGIGGAPTLISKDCKGFDIYLSGLMFYAVPTRHSVPSREELGASAIEPTLSSTSLAGLRERLERGLLLGRSASVGIDAGQRPDVLEPKLVREGVNGYNIVRCGKLYAIPQSLGPIDWQRLRSGSYREAMVGESVEELVKRIGKGAILPRIKRRAKKWIPSAVLPLIASVRRGRPPQQEPGPKKNDSIGSLRLHRRNLDEPLNRAAGSARDPIVVATLSGYDVIRYDHRYFVFHGATATLPPDEIVQRCRAPAANNLFIANTLDEARQLIVRLEGDAARVEPPLVFATMPIASIKSLLSDSGVNIDDCEFLVPSTDAPPGIPTSKLHICQSDSLLDWSRTGALPPSSLGQPKRECAILPWSLDECWTGNSLEVAAAGIANRVRVLISGGGDREYSGEMLHRLIYNKAYLSSMFHSVPLPKGQKVLEVGCSDGMVCDLVAACGAGSVTGIDVMETTGAVFPGHSYHRMSAEAMTFPDECFDLVYSIATLEHVSDPAKVLSEILRVTKRGGFAYVQAGPLYHSPFGHHMFAYFGDHPWVHLTHSTEEILALAKREGLDDRIENDLGISAEAYVRGMLTRDHVNGLFLSEYGLDEFRARPDIEVLKFNISYEGEQLLSAGLKQRLASLTPAQLTEHGFEIAFRRR